MSHPAVEGAIAGERGVRLDGRLNLTFEGRVEAELEAIFCRGSEWDTGLEHVFLLQALPHSQISFCAHKVHLHSINKHASSNDMS